MLHQGNSVVAAAISRREHGLRHKTSAHSEIKIENVHKVGQIASGWIEQAGADNVSVNTGHFLYGCKSLHSLCNIVDAKLISNVVSGFIGLKMHLASTISLITLVHYGKYCTRVRRVLYWPSQYTPYAIFSVVQSVTGALAGMCHK